MEDRKNFDASSSWFATNVRAAEKDAPAAEKFAKRIQLVEDATALKEPERIPMWSDAWCSSLQSGRLLL